MKGRKCVLPLRSMFLVSPLPPHSLGGCRVRLEWVERMVFEAVLQSQRVSLRAWKHAEVKAMAGG